MMYPLVQHQRSTTPQQNQQNQSTPLQSLSQLLQNQSQTNFQGNNSNQGQQQPLQLQNFAQRQAQQIYHNKSIEARQNQLQLQHQQRIKNQQGGQQQDQDPDVEQQNESSRERHRHRRPLYRRFFNYVREAWTGVKFALDSELEDLETPPRYRPDSLEALCKATRFTEAEIKRIYRGFKAECPTGVVREDTFKMIYAQFFPQGANTSQYAHYVFNTLDQDHSGLISFEDFVHGLSILSRGSLDEKLRWTFSLYDINGDGYITREEMTDIVSAIYDLMGKITEPCVDDDTVKDKVDRIFKKMDVNNDGVVTLDEFLECCRKDEDISSSMNVFDSAI